MQAVFLELIKLSLIGSLFAGAVMLVRLIFPKTPRWIFCLLWGVVALRLICPLSIESSISLVPDRIASGQIIASVGNEYIGDVDIIRENDTAYDSAVEAGRQPVYSEDGYYVVTEKDSLEVPKTVGEMLYPVLSWIWAAGTVSMLIYTVVSFLVLRRKMAEATRLRDNIWQCEQVESPFVLGFIKPRIYLPYAITDSDMANVIAHEKAHIHRRDHWWKPIGFVLLSLHWFNPVLWLAYVMLCRDIEAACDEKVIKHMEKDEMRAYSTALLNCSVNRRRIAACPLAFGEVGVKERVKTVMNYKKPAFWIVIAAVALCIVVAVCFLTDPKDNAPQVGNPQMLELPGVQWFVTPDELKEALNITEDQIVDETTDYDDEHDTYQLLVKNLTLFDKDVTYGEFEFWRIPGHDFAFGHAIVLFAEDTDMEALKERVSDIYGPGVDEYAFYSYVAGNKFEHMLNSKVVETLEYLAKYESQRDQLEGNPYQEALDDPEHMVHYWVPESGLSVIPAEAVEYYQYLMDQPWNEGEPLQDDDVMLEWMDQFPWVTISMGNRNAAAIQHDSKTDKAPPYSYYTNNYMEFSALNLLRYVFPVDYEYYEEAARNYSIDAELLEFPGLKWGMTPEEVKASLEISEDMILEEARIASNGEFRLTVSGSKYFGADAEAIMFRFYEYGEKTVLWNVNVHYAAGTDMTVVRDNLIEIYGPGTDYGFTNYELHRSPGETDYTVQSYIDWNFLPIDSSLRSIEYGTSIEENAKHPNPPDELVHRWASRVKGSSVIPSDDLEKLIEMFGDDVGTYADRETVMEYLDKRVPATILCRDGYTNAAGIEYRPAVAFDAGYLTLCKSVYPEDETATPLSEEGNLSALSIPGIKWLSTPEEVKDALGITGDQIISEEIDSKMSDSNGYDRYLLSATDLTLYEREIPYAYFQFRQGPDDAFALERVLVMFAEDTDMEQLKADLAGIYGPGSDEPYSYYMYSNNIKRDQELIPHAEGSLRYLANQDVVLDGVEGNPFRDALEDPEYMTHYWITENGCSVIPKQVAEYYKYLMAQPWNEREIALQDDETLMAMLDQMPWVHMTIGNRHMSTITRDAQGSEEHPYYTNNYMEFNASWLAEYVHKAETYQDSEE